MVRVTPENDDIPPLINGKQGRLPTGQELMSGPMLDPGLSTRDRTVAIVVHEVHEKLKEIFEFEDWERKRAFLLVLSFICSMIGTVMVMAGLQVSVLFAGNQENIAMAVFGFLFYAPAAYTVYFIYFPTPEEKKRREEMQARADDRSRAGYLEEMEADVIRRGNAEKKVRVIALIRGSVSRRREELPLIARTLGEVFDDIHQHTGLPYEQMVVKHKEKEYSVEKDRDVRLAKDMGMCRNEMLFVYNKGRYLTEINRVLEKKYVPEAERPPPPVPPKKEKIYSPGILESMGFGDVSFSAFRRALPIELPELRVPTTDLRSFRPKIAWESPI